MMPYSAVTGEKGQEMKKKRNYCQYCGTTIITKKIEGRMRDVCPSCGFIYYENPLPVASSIVVDEQRKLLLVKRRNNPYRGEWCLPMGFAESGEEVEEAALRELTEEAGVTGEIISLIDVDTVDNYFYGPLVIVAYEVRRNGGELKAGDDAVEAVYFPLDDLPPLAWESNTKAINIYKKKYCHLWNLADSVKQYLPEYDYEHGDLRSSDRHLHLLTSLLPEIIETHRAEITSWWIQEVTAAMPEMKQFSDDIKWLQRNILKTISFWLLRKTDTLGLEEFIESGMILRQRNIPLAPLLQALALSRKSIWLHVVRQQILSSFLDIYATLEINNRIIFFYDRIQYFLTIGYMIPPEAA